MHESISWSISLLETPTHDVLINLSICYKQIQRQLLAQEPKTDAMSLGRFLAVCDSYGQSIAPEVRWVEVMCVVCMPVRVWEPTSRHDHSKYTQEGGLAAGTTAPRIS